MDIRIGMLLVFLAGVLWSTVGLGIRLIEEAQVWQILFYRSVSLSAFLWIVIRLRGRPPTRAIRAAGLPGLIGALGLVAAYSGAIFAIQRTSVAHAMLLFACAPFFTALLGRLLGETVRTATWVAIGIGMAGIAIMVADTGGAASTTGNLAALGSALGFAVFTVALRWGGGRASTGGDMLPAVLLSGLIALPLMAVICTASGLPLTLTARDAGIALTMGVGQVGLGLLLYTMGARVVPAVELTLLSLAEVVLGPVWVWLFLGEVPTSTVISGGLVLLGAITFNAVSGARRRPPVTLA